MTKAKLDVYNEVTNQIIEALEKGVKPWKCPWQRDTASRPLRSNGEPYRGINNLLLTLTSWKNNYRNPVWLTFKQAKDLRAR